MKRAKLSALLMVLAAPSWAALPAAYAPAGKAWGGAMASFFGSPQQLAEMPKSPLTDFLGGLALKPVEFNLAVAPIVEQLGAFGLERFEALSGPAKVQAMQDVLPKAAKAVAAKALALETAALTEGVDEKILAQATEGLGQLQRSFGPFAQAGGYPAARIAEKRGLAAWRLARLIKTRMDEEMRRLQTALLGQPASGETDAAVMELTEKALTRPRRRSGAISDLLFAFQEGGSERRLSVLRALFAISETMTDRADRTRLAASLSKAMAEVRDYRVLTAGHLLLGRLNPAWTPNEYPTMRASGSRAEQGLDRFDPARLVKRPGNVPAFTDGGERYAFKVNRGAGLRARIFRNFRMAFYAAAGLAASAGGIALYEIDPRFPFALAAFAAAAFLAYQVLTAKAGSTGGATAGGRTPL